MQHPLVISGLISLVANLLIGLFVLSRQPTNRVNVLFAIFSLTVGGWSVGSFLENIIPNTETALGVLRFNYLFGVWLPAVYIHFGYCFAPMTASKRRNLRVAYIFSGLLSLAVYSPFFIKDLQVLQSVPYRYVISNPGPLYYVFFCFFSIAVLEVLKTLLSEIKSSRGQRSIQLKYLTLANAIAIFAGFEYFSRVFGLFKSPPLDDYLLVGYLLVLAYAIVKHRLLDITVVIRKSLIYSMLVTTLTVGYFGLVYAVERSFQVAFGYHSMWVSLAAFALMALCFQPLKLGIQRVVDWLFFRAPHEEMIKRMERLEHEVRQSEKLKAISTLAAGMAHEIKNPLTTIKTFAQFLPEKSGDAEFQEKFHRLVPKEVDRIDRIVRQLLDFAKPAAPSLQPTQLSQLLDETLDFLNSEALRRRIDVERSYSSHDTIQADPQQLRQVFLNLFLNSLDAMNGHGGKLTVSTATADSRLTVTVSDTGCGIPKDDLKRIFDPFFTTKPSGTGLGLSVVHGIIKEHRGTIHIDSREGQGTRITVAFPCAGA